MPILTLTTPASFSALNLPSDALHYTGPNPFDDRPSLLLANLDPANSVSACCSVYHDAPSPDPALKAGAIGHFYARDPESAAPLLAAACDSLRQCGCALAIGPMNGNTWRKYRLVSGGESEPPFFLEPSNPAWWPDLWLSSGFSPLATYHSSVIENLLQPDPRRERADARLAANGVSIRPIDLASLEANLRRIYQISRESFVSNFLYTPLPEAAFLGMYLPLKDRIDPRFALLALRDEQPVGFVFSLPDLFQTLRGQPPDTLIIKTLAVLPHRACAGLGAVLVDRMREAAAQAGFSRVIHALMHDQNVSANIGRAPRILRHYTLYSKPLT